MTDPTPAPPSPAPTPTPAPAPATPWHQGIDQELVGHWQNKGYDISDPKNIAIEATKAARELQRHFGVPADQLLKLPKDTGDEAAWRAVHTRLGVPAEAKDYDLSGVKFADGTDLEPGFVDAMRGALHKANVRKDAAADVVKSVVKYLGDADSAEAADVTAKLSGEREALARNWGTKAENLANHPNMAHARIGAQRLGVTPEEVTALENVVGYSRIMDMFRKVGRGTTEDSFHESEVSASGLPMTTAGAVARKAELMADEGWRGRFLSGDTTAVHEMSNINKIISEAA